MKNIILTIAIFSTTLPVLADGFNMPGFGTNNNNGSGWNMPNMNWGNGNGYNNGNMPPMNWGNNNGYGSNWSMPNMNWGNNQGTGSNWNMPNMNWGNNGSGSNWNMPNMNWGNNNGYNKGSNWNMPAMNWNNNSQPWSYGANRQYYAPPRYNSIPRSQVARVPAPRARVSPPQFIPKLNTKREMPTQAIATTTTKAVTKPTQAINLIPKPSDVKGVILAPENRKVIK